MFYLLLVFKLTLFDLAFEACEFLLHSGVTYARGIIRTIDSNSLNNISSIILNARYGDKYAINITNTINIPTILVTNRKIVSLLIVVLFFFFPVPTIGDLPKINRSLEPIYR